MRSAVVLMDQILAQQASILAVLMATLLRTQIRTSTPARRVATATRTTLVEATTSTDAVQRVTLAKAWLLQHRGRRRWP